MRASELAVDAELATAFCDVNSGFARLPAETQESLDIDGGKIDRLLDRCLLEGNRDDALTAIRVWRDHYLHLFEEACA